MTPRQLSAYVELHTRDEFVREPRLFSYLRNSTPYNKHFRKQLKKLIEDGE